MMTVIFIPIFISVITGLEMNQTQRSRPLKKIQRKSNFYTKNNLNQAKVVLQIQRKQKDNQLSDAL